ncbi:MAG: TVP38/TMEM64 family protein [Nitrospinae bacterium]|nr:TVP38/TMEM64 family protein [Nitrospinota bacterium]
MTGRNEERATDPSPPSSGAGTAPEAGRRGRLVRFVLFVALLAVMVFLVAGTDVGRFFERGSVEALLAEQGRPVAALLFVAVYVVGTILTVPGTILSLLGGALFGVWLGTALVIVGATLGACGAFFVARFMARDFVAERFGKAAWIARIDRGIAEEGIWFILFIRVVPLFPFNWINYAAGLTRVRSRDFVLGTAIGIIPGSFVYVNVAARATDAVTAGHVTPELGVALGLLGLLALVPIVYRRMKRMKTEKDE